MEKIKAEKEALIKKGKLKRQNLITTIEDKEKYLSIPKNWAWCRLFDITSLLGDGIHGTPQYDIKGKYYFINGNNLIDGKITFKDNTKTVNREEYDKHQKPLNKKTVFVSINGTLGNIAFYNDEPIILGKSACYFNLMDGINKEYIKVFVDSNYFLDYANFVASETTIKNVSLKSMRLMLFPIPPLAEQKAIVEKVEKLLNWCDALEAKIAESERLNGLLMQTVVKEYA